MPLSTTQPVVAPAARAVLAQLGAHRDELPRVHWMGARVEGTTARVRVEPSRRTGWVRLHVQSNEVGGALYDPATYAASTLYDCRADRVLDASFSADPRLSYYVWAVPAERDGLGGELPYDGQDGRPDFATRQALLANTTYDIARDFGAVGDGLTDATAALSDAVAAVAAFGAGTIWIPEGRSYVIGDTVTAVSGLRIAGGGRLYAPDRLELGFLTGSGLTDVSIDGVALEGSNTSYAPSVVERLLYFQTSAYLRVTRCDISACAIGAQFETCDGVWFERNSVHDTVEHTDGSECYGALVTLGSTGWHLDRNDCRRMGRHALYVSSGSSNGSVSFNFVDGSKSVAINFHSHTDQARMSGIACHGNQVANVGGGAGISPRGISLTGNIESATLLGNTVRDTDGYGIAVEGGAAYASGTNPEGIIIADNSVLRATTHGIWVVDASGVLVTGNRVKDLQDGGTGITITCDNDGTYATTTANVVVGPNLVDGAGHALNVSSSGGDFIRDVRVQPFMATNIAAGKYLVYSSANLANTTFEYPEQALVWTVASIAAGAANTRITAPVPFFRTPRKAYLVDLTLDLSGSISGDSVYAMPWKDSVFYDTSELVTCAPGSTVVSRQFAPGDFAVLPNERFGVGYRTGASLTFSGTLSLTVIARLIFDPD
jgi:hypothetical protein